MNLFIEIVIAILGIGLGVVGAWDKIVVFITHLKNRKNERKLISIERRVDKLERLKNENNYLLAVLVKRLFQFLTVLFFSILIGPLNEAVGPGSMLDASTKIHTIVLYILTLFAGFYAGNAIGVAGSVIQYKKTKEKLESSILEIKRTLDSPKNR